jgi:hypothetical protein
MSVGISYFDWVLSGLPDGGASVPVVVAIAVARHGCWWGTPEDDDIHCEL